MNHPVRVRFEERPAGAATMTPEMLNAVNYYHWTMEQITPYLGRRILDIGGGYGSHLEMLVRSGLPIVSIDLSSQSVDFMNDRFRAYSNFRASQLDFGSELGQEELVRLGVDTITCMNVLEHIEDDRGALRHMHTILKDTRGVLLLQVPAHPWLYGSLDAQAGHFRRYSAAYLRSVLEGAGFTIRRLYHFNSFGVLPWFMNARIFRQKLEAASMNAQVKVFDRYFVPVLRQVEKCFRLPIGQSLMAIADAR